MKQVKKWDCSGVPFAWGFGICMGIGTFLMYRDRRREYDTLREYVAVEGQRKERWRNTAEENQEETVTVDFEALKK